MHSTEIQIHAIFSSVEHNYFTRPKHEASNYPNISHTSIFLEENRGIKGDRFEFSKYPLTFLSLEVATEVCKELDIPLNLELFRRNIIISGVHLNSLIGARFSIGEVEFEGLEHCAPCTWMNAVMKKGAYAQMRGRGGLRAKVIKEGSLHVANNQLYSSKALHVNILKALKRPNLP